MQAVRAQMMPATRGPQPAQPARRSAQISTWRLQAASLFGPEPQGPFSFWPRAGDNAAKAKQPPAAAKPVKKPASAAEEAEDLPSQEMHLGQPRFRSALEQVSYYTNQSAFSRE